MSCEEPPYTDDGIVLEQGQRDGRLVEVGLPVPDVVDDVRREGLRIHLQAKAQGLRAVVHAHDPASIIAAVKAGCSEVEHGVFADDAAIAAMKAANVFFDPNIGLVLQNYIENKAKFLGAGSYTDEGFAFMEKAVPTLGPIFKKALDANTHKAFVDSESATADRAGISGTPAFVITASGQKEGYFISGAQMIGMGMRGDEVIDTLNLVTLQGLEHDLAFARILNRLGIV